MLLVPKAAFCQKEAAGASRAARASSSSRVVVRDSHATDSAASKRPRCRGSVEEVLACADDESLFDDTSWFNENYYLGHQNWVDAPQKGDVVPQKGVDAPQKGDDAPQKGDDAKAEEAAEWIKALDDLGWDDIRQRVVRFQPQSPPHAPTFNQILRGIRQHIS